MNPSPISISSEDERVPQATITLKHLTVTSFSENLVYLKQYNEVKIFKVIFFYGFYNHFIGSTILFVTFLTLVKYAELAFGKLVMSQIMPNLKCA